MSPLKLSKEQQIAATQQGNILLTACPGSGKTRVIIHKLANDIAATEGTKRRVAAVTFTIRASEEIYRRLSLMNISHERAWSGTLHAFCLEWILKPYYIYISELRSGFTIADQSFCDGIVLKLKLKHGLEEIDPVNFRFNRDGSFQETRFKQGKVLNDYHKILRENKLIDFELILLYSYQILCLHPNIGLVLSNIFHSICIDEYQDTQDLLYAIICNIIKSGDGKTAVVFVGDLDQAIYASLGGVAKNISQLGNEIDELPIIPLSLSGNYRSSQRIIDLYSAFQTQPIRIEAVGENAKYPSIITFNDDISQKHIPQKVASLIEFNLSQGIDQSQICVLVPQWWLVTSITRSLKALLPTVNFDASGLSPMSRNRDNIWYKISRLFLTTSEPRLYSVRYKWAKELLSDIVEATEGSFSIEFFNERKLLRTINSIQSGHEDGVEYLTDCFDKLMTILDIDYQQFPTLFANREQFFEAVNDRITDPDFNVPSDIASFKSFYREMTGVVIQTCVGVKGEEFDAVIAYGLLEGYVPHWNEIFSGTSDNASKKLLYVICSRAKKNLHLISETGRTTRRGTPLETNQHLAGLRFNFDVLE